MATRLDPHQQETRRLDPPAIDPGTDIGHVHLKVADLDRALAFYHGALGFELTGRLGDQAAFVSAGGYHHHIGLNTWESRGGSPPPRGTTGLYHVAIRYPSRPALARALRALIERRYPIDGASDHAVSEAIYLRDPDGNGIELYWDRPRDEWPVAAGRQLRDGGRAARSRGPAGRGRQGLTADVSRALPGSTARDPHSGSGSVSQSDGANAAPGSAPTTNIVVPASRATAPRTVAGSGT